MADKIQDCKSFAAGLRAVLAKHEQEMVQLRARELRKGGDICIVCGKLDKPGFCTCLLRKGESFIPLRKDVAGKPILDLESHADPKPYLDRRMGIHNAGQYDTGADGKKNPYFDYSDYLPPEAKAEGHSLLTVGQKGKVVTADLSAGGGCIQAIRHDDGGYHVIWDDFAQSKFPHKLALQKHVFKALQDHLTHVHNAPYVTHYMAQDSVQKSEISLSKSESCPVCKNEDKPGVCKCFKKEEMIGGTGVRPGQDRSSMHMSEKTPKKIGGDEGSGGPVKDLNKGALAASALPPPVPAEAKAKPKLPGMNVRTFGKAPTGAMPSPVTSVGKVNTEMGGFESLIGGSPAPTMSAKLTGAVPPPPTMAQTGTKAMAAPKSALGGLNDRGLKSLLAVPTRKGEKGWSKKAKN